jgi:site-specific recombinase XerD
VSRNSQPQLRVLPTTSTDLDLALTIFITAKEAKRCTARTVRTYRWTLQKFLDWLGQQGVGQIQALTSHHIRQFLADLDKQGHAASYIHIYARTIKTWVRFLYSEGLIPADPMATVGMPRLDKEIMPAFAPADVRTLLAVCETARDTALVYCLLDSGCRAAELCALTLGDVNVKTGCVMVRQGKGRKDRVTFVSAKARRALLKYLMTRPNAQADQPLFPSCKTGEQLTPNGLLLLLRRLGKRAGIANCHPHTFRRTFVLWSLRAGMDVFALQQIMGHSDLTMLRKYLAQVQADLETAHKRHGAVDNML